MRPMALHKRRQPAMRGDTFTKSFRNETDPVYKTTIARCKDDRSFAEERLRLPIGCLTVADVSA